MSKKNKSGLAAFVVGLAAGAAAVFLSKKENRDKVQQGVDKTIKQAKQLKEEVEEDPQKVKAKAEKKAKEIAGQVKEKVCAMGKKVKKETSKKS